MFKGACLIFVLVAATVSTLNTTTVTLGATGNPGPVVFWAGIPVVRPGPVMKIPKPDRAHDHAWAPNKSSILKIYP